MRLGEIGDSLLWRHVRTEDGHHLARTDSVFLCGGCTVVRRFVQEGKFVAKFTAVVSSNSIVIDAVWREA